MEEIDVIVIYACAHAFCTHAFRCVASLVAMTPLLAFSMFLSFPLFRLQPEEIASATLQRLVGLSPLLDKPTAVALLRAMASISEEADPHNEVRAARAWHRARQG